MSSVQENPQQTQGAIDYESKFNDVQEGLNYLLNEVSEDDAGAQEKIGVALNEGFDKWIKDNPDKAQALKGLIEQFVKKINSPDSSLKKEDFSAFLEFARNVLGVDIEGNISSTDNVSGLPDLELEGDLSGLDKEGNSLPLCNGLVKEKPTDGSENDIESEKRFYEASEKLDNQIDEVGKLLENELLRDNENLKSLKAILVDIKTILEHTTRGNVRLLQKFIYDNLEGGVKDLFRSKNYSSKLKNFDGKFGVNTLKGFNLVLDKIGDYLDNIKKQYETQGDSSVVEQDDNAGTSATTGGENGGSGSTNMSGSQSGGGGDQSSTTGQSAGDGTQSSPEGQSNPVDTAPLSYGDNNYGVIQSSSLTMGDSSVDATFYSTQPLPSGQAIDGQNMFVEAPVGDEYECYLKLSNKPNNLYRVRVDSSGNLCPIAAEIDTTIKGKDGNSVETNVLFKNNSSCINYLKNKLPSGLDCEISWNDEKEDYQLVSYGDWITIEPMTVGQCWVSDDLTECLALLNFVNYLTSGSNENLKGKDPDLKWKKNALFVETKNGWGELSSEFLAGLGLGNVSKDVWKRFIHYNNEEGRLRNSDSLEVNNFKKIDFPSVMLVMDGVGTGGQEQPQGQQQEQVEDQVSDSDIQDVEQNQFGQVDGEYSDNSGLEGQQQEQVEDQGSDSDIQDVEQSQSEQLDQSGDFIETNNIVDISALWDVDNSDYEAMQSFLQSEKQFVKKSDDSISCNLSKVKSYLEEIKDNEGNYFDSLKGGEYTAWIVAVQILLNEWRKINIGEKAGIRVTGKLFDGPYDFDRYAYSTIGNLAMFKSKVGLDSSDGFPKKDTISKLLELIKITDNQPIGLGSEQSGSGNLGDVDDGGSLKPDGGNEGNDVVNNGNGLITERVDNLDVNQPVIDLSELTSLNVNDVEQILKGVSSKLGGAAPSNPLLLKLDGLKSLDLDVANKLSDWKGGISVKGIIDGIDFNNCDPVIELLNNLAPDGKEVKIIVFDSVVGETLKNKGVKNVEFNTLK